MEMKRIIGEKKLIWALLFLIVLLGAFLRFWHFSDWLHFELDQARDAKVVDLALSGGPEALPLLGPKAAGSFLRLGPAFYYFMYLSALIFGQDPSGMAMITAVFGVLAIVVFYFLLRRYFRSWLSLVLTSLFAASLFLVMYSRFSWNPNALPFFVLLAFYALLRTVDFEEKRKGLWLLVFSFCSVVATQLHFLAFVAVPVVSLTFLVLKRPKIKIGYFLAAFLLGAFLYLPAVINDVATGGKNIGQFFAVAEKKSSKDDHNSLEKLIKNYNEHALGYFTVLFGRSDRELPRVLSSKEGFLELKCDQGCRSGLSLGILAWLIFSSGLFFLVKNFFGEKNLPKRDFLLLGLLWFGTVFVLFFSIAYDISPRFFLLSAPLAFVFYGFLLEFLSGKTKNRVFFKLLAAGLFVWPLCSNFLETKDRFWQMKNAPQEAFEIGADRILKEKNRVTLKQQIQVVGYIFEIYQKNGYPVYLNSEPHYRRSLIYHLSKKGVPYDDFRNSSNEGKVYRQGNYFLVHPAFSNLDLRIGKYSENFLVIEEKSFGTLVLFRLSPKDASINAERQEFSKNKNSSSSAPERYRWEEIFNSENEEEDEGE